MAITINGDTGLTLPASSSITGSSTTITGITSVASNAANTPIILQDSSSNSNTCRAWVNFNGTSTVAIRADFNVSSITDNGTGDYTVNFTNALTDANYAITATSSRNSTGGAGADVASAYPISTTAARVSVSNVTPTAVDSLFCQVAIFR